MLTETESKALLAAFRIPVAKTVVARSLAEAIVNAEQLGFPVAMKVSSPDIVHKSEARGVRLDIRNAQELRAAYTDIIASVKHIAPDAHIEGIAIQPMGIKQNGRELMVGVVTDPQFGPVITFGAGGSLVEVLADRAVALPPLNGFLARDLIGRTRIAKTLGSYRNLPAARLDALVEVLERVSEMVCEAAVDTRDGHQSAHPGRRRHHRGRRAHHGRPSRRRTSSGAMPTWRSIRIRRI